jgi:threonine dehydratase
METAESAIQRVRQEILLARSRVYAVHPPTPLDEIELDGGTRLFLKREDCGPIHAYKWRGAYNKMATLTEEERNRGVVTASAGNHAQGVALAASRLGIRARIHMPQTTPLTKQEAVRQFGGNWIEVRLAGDDFGSAAEAAQEDVAASGAVFVSAYDDWQVMGGQDTLADEIVMSGKGPFDVCFLQIGGGGMASSVAAWLRQYYPDLPLIGVEGLRQQSLKASLQAGKPVRLDYVDLFSDGTAIPSPGEKCFPILRALLDEVIAVDNDELSHAIAVLWRKARFIAEPAGAMGLAGLLQQAARWQGKKVLAVCCGANMDFAQLGAIARKAGIGSRQQHFLRVEISEAPGSLLQFLETFLREFAVTEFQYGKHHPTIARYVLGVMATPPEFLKLQRALDAARQPWEDVTGHEDVKFRSIRYDPGLWENPLLARLEFNDRPGALLDILRHLAPQTSFCYFNFASTGERVGRALVGLQFTSGRLRSEFIESLAGGSSGILRQLTPLSPTESDRILG